jgi:HD domain
MISLGTDLGMGHPTEHMLRQSLIALRLAERLGLDDSTRGAVYYVGLGQEVRDGLYQTFERWDGKGVPAEARGEEILAPPAAAAVVLRLLGPRAWWMPAWLDRRLPSLGLSHGIRETRARP